MNVRLRAIRAGQSIAGRAHEPPAVQPARAAHGLRGREQDLLGVAAALPAGAAVGEAVDDRHPQARLRAPRRHVLRRGAAADDDDVVLGHRSLLRSPRGWYAHLRRGRPAAPFRR